MGTFLKLLGIGASALLTVWGMGEEEKQQKKLMGVRRRERREEKGIQMERIGVEKGRLRLQEQTQRFAQREAQRKWKWMEEEQKYQRATDFSNRFMGILDRGDVNKKELVSVWGRGR